MEFKRIDSLYELKDLFVDFEYGERNESSGEFFVQLNGGFRSWKSISYFGDDQWYVLHEIDETEEELTSEELMNSIIGEAIQKGQLYFAWF